MIIFFLSSCYIDTFENDTFIIPENSCDCVYYDYYSEKWYTMKLRPGIIYVGWQAFNRKDYCEQVQDGYLTNCN